MFSRYSLLPYRTTHLDSMCDVAYFREGRVALCAQAAASRAAAGSGAGPGLSAGALPALDELHMEPWTSYQRASTILMCVTVCAIKPYIVRVSGSHTQKERWIYCHNLSHKIVKTLIIVDNKPVPTESEWCTRLT